jgi:hypothetical protein
MQPRPLWRAGITIQIQGVDAARIIVPVVFVWPDNEPSAMHGELQPRHQSKMKRVRVKTLLEKVQLPPREAILILVSSANGGFGVGMIPVARRVVEKVYETFR